MAIVTTWPLGSATLPCNTGLAPREPRPHKTASQHPQKRRGRPHNANGCHAAADGRGAGDAVQPTTWAAPRAAASPWLLL